MAGIVVSAPDLVGRAGELAALFDLIDDIKRQGAVLVVLGDAGIGKSSLLRAAADHAWTQGCVLLEATGVESETQLPFAGLHQLLRPILADLDAVPPAQQRALRAAFGIEDAPAPDLFLTALAALSLITETATSRPVVIVADDVQWLDNPTRDVLAFLARRVTSDPIVMLFAQRSGYPSAISDQGAPDLQLRGLDDGSARELLARAAADLSVSEREAVLHQAVGNPLALVELPLAWRGSRRIGDHTERSVVPLSARLERAFAARIDELPSATRDALLIAAIDPEEETAEILSAARTLAAEPLTIDVFEPAAAVGIVEFDQARVRFRHPLMRSGILQGESSRRRQAAHAAVAAVLSGHAFRRTWHHAQAIIGPDDGIADELEQSHLESIRRGAVTTAISALERSAQLTTDLATRGRRLLLAAEHAFGLGRADIVDRLVTAAANGPLSDLDRARMEWLREIFNDGVPGDSARVLILCHIAERSAAAGDTDLALNLLLGAALRGWWADTGPEARARVASVTTGLSGVTDDPRYVAALAVSEPILAGRTVLEILSEVSVETVDDADGLRLLGMAAHAVGDQPRAADYLDRAEKRLRDQGRIGLLPHVLGMQGAVRIDLGDWARADSASEEGRRLAADTGQPIWSTGTLVNEARAAGLRGNSRLAFQLAAECEQTPTLGPLTDFLACAQLARGFALITAGRHNDAFDALRRVFDPADPSHHHREQFCGVTFLAEAAVYADRRDEGRRIITDMEHIARITPSPLLHTHLLYARAVLADDQDAERLYRAALATDLTRWPWISARIQFAYGTWLRRQRRVAESREPLRQALTMFRLIGGHTWAEQARAELRAAGDRQMTAETASIDVLSPQEQQIAKLAAQGLSNREIGEQLFLSPRTVGSHLYRIFPKLDITSRTQLAARLADG